MTTVTKLPTAEARELAKQLAVEAAERIGRQLLALAMLEHDRRDELLAGINSGELLPRVVINLSGARPLIEC